MTYASLSIDAVYSCAVKSGRREYSLLFTITTEAVSWNLPSSMKTANLLHIKTALYTRKRFAITDTILAFLPKGLNINENFVTTVDVCYTLVKIMGQKTVIVLY